MRAILGRKPNDTVSQPDAIMTNISPFNSQYVTSLPFINQKDEFEVNGRLYFPLTTSEFFNKFDEEMLERNLQDLSISPGSTYSISSQENPTFDFMFAGHRRERIKVIDLKESVGTNSSINHQASIPKKRKDSFCVMCKRNGECAQVYRSHTLRDQSNKISCPVLRSYNCPVCNNHGGDYAHTLRYCPKNVGPNRILSVIEKIKSGRKSCGNLNPRLMS